MVPIRQLIIEITTEDFAAIAEILRRIGDMAATHPRMRTEITITVAGDTT